jgi:hypothetical protein
MSWRPPGLTRNNYTRPKTLAKDKDVFLLVLSVCDEEKEVVITFTPRRFLMSMSHLPWTEQIRFKKVFDLSLQQKNGRNKKPEEAPSGLFGEKKFW